MMKSNNETKNVPFILKIITIILGVMIFCASNAVNYLVTRNDDPAPDGCLVMDCSLREAVIAANNTTGIHVIELEANEYLLTLQGSDNASNVGDLDIDNNISIIGILSTQNNPNFTSINASGLNDRIFDVRSGASFHLSQLQIKNGGNFGLQGGGIRAVEALVTLDQVSIDFNTAMIGGGIYSQYSEITVYNSSFIENQTTGSGGGILLNEGQLQINNSQFIENQADENGGAIRVNREQTLTNANFVEINNSNFLNNIAVDNGGALFASSSSQLNNQIKLHQLLFNNNSAQRGGAIYQKGTLTLSLEGSTLWGNQALKYNSNMFALGGGIYVFKNPSSELLISYSLLANNLSQSYGGGVYATSVTDIYNSTITGNQALDSSGLYLSGLANLAHVTVYNNITTVTDVEISFNDETMASVINSIFSSSCEFGNNVSYQSLGGNIESPGNSCQFGAGDNDISGSLLTTLVDDELLPNGGLSLSLKIKHIYSPAIANGVPFPAINDDQRSYIRDKTPDSGAIEAQPGEVDVYFDNGFESFN